MIPWTWDGVKWAPPELPAVPELPRLYLVRDRVPSTRRGTAYMKLMTRAELAAFERENPGVVAEPCDSEGRAARRVRNP